MRGRKKGGLHFQAGSVISLWLLPRGPLFFERGHRFYFPLTHTGGQGVYLLFNAALSSFLGFAGSEIQVKEMHSCRGQCRKVKESHYFDENVPASLSGLLKTYVVL